MSNQLQTKEELSEEEKEAKAAMMKYMTGEEGLEVFTRALREEGVVLPKGTSPSVKIVVASSNWSSNLPWGDGFYDDEIHQREERARAQPNERAA